MHHAALLRRTSARPGWPSKSTLLLCMAGIVLPNALSLGALIAGVGAPPRTTAIIAYATLALIARSASPLMTIVLYLAVAIYDVIVTIALLFNLAPSEIGLALHLSADLDLFASPLYVGLIAALLALAGANIAMLTLERSTLQQGNAAVMMVFALLLAAADFATNTSPHYHYGTLYGKAAPMESAAEGSGFRQTALAAKKNHVLMVVVEALGQFADPWRQSILLQPFGDADLRRRYDVTSGSTTYYGSTTAGEMRELCNTREPYKAVLEGRNLGCLPARMTASGYRTIAVHNFISAFFQRQNWYPALGFEKQIFGEQLSGLLPRRCGGPFKGPCDVDVVPLIAKQLREAKRPTFLYWLTLSTHVPIASHEGTPRLGCTRDGGPIGQVEVCYMTEMWMDVFEAIARMTANIPETEILLVGDHAPPLWSKAGRRLFEPGKVTWVRLTPRADASRTAKKL